MLRFYATSALFFASVFFLSVADIVVAYRLVAVSAVVFVYTGVLVWASAQIRSQFYVKTFCRNKAKNDEVAITFDDGPDLVNTPQLIELLDEYGARATFFIIGKKIEEHANLVKKLYLHGHSVGNHSYCHASTFPLKTSKEIAKDVQKTQDLLHKTLCVRNVLFRPPFGVTNPMIAWGINKLGLVSVGWSIRSLDTVKTKEEALDRVIQKVLGGDIVLLHDTTKDIVWITREILKYLKRNDLRAVTVHELLSKNDCK